jgi:CRISPR-associated endonuclease/helicase Cas3
MYYAHSKNAAGNRQGLVEHLHGVAGRAREFAAPLGATDLAEALGLWHDLGKFNTDWQQYLRECETDPKRRFGKKIDHKAAGALLAYDGGYDKLALIVQAHHGGLKTESAMLNRWLPQRERALDLRGILARARQHVPELASIPPLEFPAHAVASHTALEIFLRLLFSALVDADGLDTESHTHPERTALRPLSVTMEELWAHFNAQPAPQQGMDDVAGYRAEVAGYRAKMYAACVAAAERDSGVFRLTMPTGGGKTRSGLAFALRHATLHGQERIIVAVPFISITEQTARTYRNLFAPLGENVVLEHHSAARDVTADKQTTAIDVTADEEGEPQSDMTWARLSAENWEAPIVVTTTVQLFESLFSNRVGACRKLHRLANSVIVLDEVQALPPRLLDPILDALRTLAAYYNTTVVLSTATQPEYEFLPIAANADFQQIVEEAKQYFAAMQRVHYEWCMEREMPWAEVAALMREQSQCLAVVNTKADATALWDALGGSDDPNAFALSTNLCGVHRHWVIEEMRRRLDPKVNEPCLLVSTQVIEAGVDLDFPRVLRAFAPLPSVIQAAGRCNREGKLGFRGGEVIVFRSEGDHAPSGYRVDKQLTEAWLANPGRDPDNLDDLAAFFKDAFAFSNTDEENIQQFRAALDYPKVAEKFRMIDDDTESVIVTDYKDDRQLDDERPTVRELIEVLYDRSGRARDVMRELQPYIVAVRRDAVPKLRSTGIVGPEIIPGVSEWLRGNYDEKLGIVAGQGWSAVAYIG